MRSHSVTNHDLITLMTTPPAALSLHRYYNHFNFLCAGVPQYIQSLGDLRNHVVVTCHKSVVLFTCLAETNNFCVPRSCKPVNTFTMFTFFMSSNIGAGSDPNLISLHRSNRCSFVLGIKDVNWSGCDNLPPAVAISQNVRSTKPN